MSEPLPSAFFLAATAAAVEQTVIMYFIAPATELPGKDEAGSIFPMAGGKCVAGLAEDYRYDQ